MLRRVALGALAVASPLLVVACGIGGTSSWLFVIPSLLVPVALIALAASTLRDSRRVLLPLLALGALLVGSGAGILWLPAPASTWLMAFGLGLLPLLVVGLGFAVTFDAGGDRE
ncbi:MAG: hypothetical protein GY716_10675 [bacterium]|nr:hypothetical protein [bacterium]